MLLRKLIKGYDDKENLYHTDRLNRTTEHFRKDDDIKKLQKIAERMGIVLPEHTGTIKNQILMNKAVVKLYNFFNDFDFNTKEMTYVLRSNGLYFEEKDLRKVMNIILSSSNDKSVGFTENKGKIKDYFKRKQRIELYSNIADSMAIEFPETNKPDDWYKVAERLYEYNIRDSIEDIAKKLHVKEVDLHNMFGYVFDKAKIHDPKQFDKDSSYDR